MKYLLLIASSLVLSTPALAQDGEGAVVVSDPVRDDLITVVATGTREFLSDTGQSIAIVGRAEIESVQGPDLSRVLQRLPGVTITRNGGLGAFTGVRIRGADSEQTLVLVDGARVADVSSPGSGFDFGTLLSGSVDKVELLRGPNSLIWGSDAIGGVVAVTTRQMRGVEASAEYGAYNTVSGSAAGGFAAGGLGLTLNGGYARSDGFSALAADSEKDGFEQWQAGARATYDLGSGLTAFADARYARSQVGIDFSFANNYVQTTRQASGRAGLRYYGDALDLAASFSLADTRRAYDSPTFGYGYDGQDQLADLRGKWRVAPGVALIFGASHAFDRYDGTFDARQSATQSSGHALIAASRGAFTVTGGVRIDHHSRFGDAWTMGGDATLGLGHGWRLRAAYGEGFKAPTLYQLYGFAGNLSLSPERSHSWEAGVEKNDRGAPTHFSATVFRRENSNLIDYDANANGGWGGYFNVSRTRATGFELEAGVRPVESLDLRATYSYVEAINRTTGRDLYRRPRHALTLSGDWTTPLHALVLGADLRLVGNSIDDPAGDTDPTNDVRLNGYAVLTLRASLPVTERIEVYGRVENVTDARYQALAGYNTPGRSAYIGARARF